MDPQPPSEPPKPVPLPGSGVIDTEFGIPVLGELPRTASPPPIPASASPPTAAPASVESPERHLPIRRRVVLPLVLFLATCASTFWVGSQAGVAPANIVRNLPGAITFRDVGVYGIWSSGLVYMTAVMTILFAHEMGHFFFCLRHRVPASLPFFIPMPTGPLGTMGAVIGMQSSTANRRELFDVGLAGPLAGLIVALPIAWYGILTAEPFPVNVKPTWHFQDPLLFKALIAYLHPDLPAGRELTANPLYMAGWVGMLITGLNMMPISQLDGGHVAYALFVVRQVCAPVGPRGDDGGDCLCRLHGGLFVGRDDLARYVHWHRSSQDRR
jgi:Zn-dependent protease